MAAPLVLAAGTPLPGHLLPVPISHPHPKIPTIDQIRIADEPERWSALGFALEGHHCPLGSVELELVGGVDEGEGVLGWSLRGVQGTELDGLPTALSTRPVAPPAPVHPNGVIGIDHVVAVSPCFQRSVDAMQAAGLDLRRVREEPTPAGAPRQAFFRLGSEILEMVEEPEHVVQRDGGPDRPVRFWGLALLVEDIDATVAAMAPHAGQARAAVQRGRRISTVARSAGLSFPMALISRADDQEVKS
jgi:hypothetical protein